MSVLQKHIGAAQLHFYWSFFSYSTCIFHDIVLETSNSSNTFRPFITKTYTTLYSDNFCHLCTVAEHKKKKKKIAHVVFGRVVSTLIVKLYRLLSSVRKYSLAGL